MKQIFLEKKKNMMISDKFDPHEKTKRQNFAFELFRPRNSWDSQFGISYIITYRPKDIHTQKIPLQKVFIQKKNTPRPLPKKKKTKRQQPLLTNEPNQPKALQGGFRIILSQERQGATHQGIVAHGWLRRCTILEGRVLAKSSPWVHELKIWDGWFGLVCFFLVLES